MLKFLIYFLVVQLFLFSIEQLIIVRELVIIPFTEWIAQVSAWIVQLFDGNVASNGVVLQHIGNGFSVSIESGCNGVEAILVLISAILVFPTTWKFKLQGIVVGFIAVELLNIVRIISLFYLGQWNQEIFDWAHLYIWEALIMLDILIVFLWWMRLLPIVSETENHAV